MAAATGMQLALLLCLVVLVASPRVALGNCRDDCMAACNGWHVMCQLSCGSACYGEVGITTLSTPDESSARAEAPASAAPAPQQAQEQEEGGGVSGLKPSPARG
ncbi:hypothetical protein BDA96_01G001700 [Sorghum bicolor]|uniref:Acidic protein n=2 Tax=Sorghum bicolor TaxID=4558 RepID=C5WRU4_SORBI|nr:uncharacterized protein LOC8061369 [Sorghum bicolor]EER90458.1 hypothetical protein SORBI_3001G001800 [Sorghum bicolor]KAG0546523.1 hypothetical protein BDA96_01G001700 [Sorghum bicolor]OQU90582.1 hypothetical protein SORBI_3001G001800 [Sorghum bicolor]|eukprot:XP_002463460.1 uncharacterized protein LOC8061369 [Sorghum bicolor]